MRKVVSRIFAFLCIVAFTLSSAPGRAAAENPLPPQPPAAHPQPAAVHSQPAAAARFAPRPGAAFAGSGLGQAGTVFSYVKQYGETELPYTVDPTLLNRPEGLFLDDSGTLFVSEERGVRVVRSDPTYNPIGTTGVSYTGDYAFVNPVDIAKDKNGNLWVADYSRVVEYDASGVDAVHLQDFPAVNSWVTGNENDRFDNISGLAFDHQANEHLFVSDSRNNRVQVFSFDNQGKPVYENTIGGFDNPGRLTVDAAGQLLVLDVNNNRVQRCNATNTNGEDPWKSWLCSTFPLTKQGGPTINLGNPLGIAVDPNGNVLITDSANYRILRCGPDGGCIPQVTGLQGWGVDVAGKANGDVYVADWTLNVVRQFNAQGVEQPVYMGVENLPYETAPGKYNSPRGVTVGPDGSMYVVEQYGYRLVKLNSNGQEQWTFGAPGVFGGSNDRLGDFWSGLEGNPAVDSAGRVYVPDTSNQRVVILNANGTFYNQIGETWNPADDNTHLNCPVAVAINPLNNDIVIADKCHQRIQVFSSSLKYKATLGTLNQNGDDNKHFNSPWGVTVDAKGAVYVADSDNFRVQKCTYTSGSNYSCSTLAGETGVYDQGYTHIHPISVAVDAQGRVFAADDWNNRVEVFNASGGYLTTLGGSWGTRTTDLRNAGGVAVDKRGYVYVVDPVNARMLVFAPRGSGDWMQINLNGFGKRNDEGVWSLAWFNQTLYAGVSNPYEGAEIWRKSAQNGWEPVMTGGFGNTHNWSIDHLFVYGEYLYASTLNASDDPAGSQGGEIWRSKTGSLNSWQPVVTGGSGSETPDPINGEFFRMFAFDNQLCATSWASSNTHGSEIWCSPSGDAGTWDPLVTNGLGDPTNTAILDVESHGGRLLASTYNMDKGGTVYSSTDGKTWGAILPMGWGDAGNFAVTSMHEFNGSLYVVFTHVGGGSSYGVTVGRCQECLGSDWQEVSAAANGFGDPNTRNMAGFEVHNGELYLAVTNSVSGLHVFKTADGDTWQTAAPFGFGSPSSTAVYWGNSILSAGGDLYIGNWTLFGAGQVWQLSRKLFLPFTFR